MGAIIRILILLSNSILMVAFTVAGVARTTSTTQQQQPRP